MNQCTRVIQITHMFVVYGLRAVADHQHKQGRAEEKDDSKVEVMDPTHYERAVGGENTAAGTKPELRQHATQTHCQSTHQAPESTLEEGTGGE